MEAPIEGINQTPSEFQLNTSEPLLELNMTDSTELWLIQWPINQPSDFDGQEVALKLHHDGRLGTFEGSSGKSYDVVSFSAQQPNATVFSSSEAGSKIVGKITRRVSLIHYPEPRELPKLSSSSSILRETSQRSSGISSTKSVRMTPTHTNRSRKTHASGNAASTHSSRQKSSLSEEKSKPSKRKRENEPSESIDHSAKSSRGNSAVASSGSLENSQGKESKRKKKN